MLPFRLLLSQKEGWSVDLPARDRARNPVQKNNCSISEGALNAVHCFLFFLGIALAVRSRCNQLPHQNGSQSMFVDCPGDSPGRPDGAEVAECEHLWRPNLDQCHRLSGSGSQIECQKTSVGSHRMRKQWKPDFTEFSLPPYLSGILGNPNHCQGPWKVDVAQLLGPGSFQFSEVWEGRKGTPELPNFKYYNTQLTRLGRRVNREGFSTPELSCSCCHHSSFYVWRIQWFHIWSLGLRFKLQTISM